MYFFERLDYLFAHSFLGMVGKMDRTLSNTFKLIENEELLLPDFQRDYKWNTAKQRSLLASILLNFPVGGSLILQGKSQDFALRKIGEKEQFLVTENKDCEYLLDGQQRTTTLYNALNNTFDYDQFSDQNELNDFVSAKANPLKVRWFLRFPGEKVDPKAIKNNDKEKKEEINKDVTDVFGAKKLEFTLDKLEEYEPEQIIDIFHDEVFNEKNNKGISKWFSPYYQLSHKVKGVPSASITNYFVNSCSDNGLVPLFMLGTKDGAGIVKRILRKIGRSNADNLKDKYRGNISFVKDKFDKEQKLAEYETIQDIESDGEDYEKLLDEVFRTLLDEWVNDVSNYLIRDIYESYQLSSLVTNDIRRAIPIFCHLNDGGMPLDDFDLVSAKAAKKLATDTSTYSLSKIVRDYFSQSFELCAPLKIKAGTKAGMLNLENLDQINDGLPKGYLSNSILALCTMLAKSSGSSDYRIKKTDTSSKTLLSLTTEDIRANVEKSVISVLRAFSFLVIRCGVYNASKLHYKLMIQPIAYALSDDSVWNDQSALDKVEYWYWASVFSGKYLYDQSAVVIEDINLLKAWVHGGNGKKIKSREKKLFSIKEYCSKKLLTQQLNEYPKEGIRSIVLQYVLSAAPYDLLKDDIKKLTAYQLDEKSQVTLWPISASEGLNDHHIVPLDLVKTLGQKTEVIRKDPNHVLNSPLNRVLISGNANNIISSLDPVRYFDELGKSGLYSDIILSSQFIGSDFKKINSSSLDEKLARKALEQRFEEFEKSVRSRLLELVS